MRKRDLLIVPLLALVGYLAATFLWGAGLGAIGLFVDPRALPLLALGPLVGVVGAGALIYRRYA